MSSIGDHQVSPETRRSFVRKATASSAAAAALLGGFGMDPMISAAMAQEMGRSEKPLRAAFSNAGLQATWCAQGKQAAEFWGRLFNVEVTWFDGELSATKQRAAIDNMASQKWDFVAIQAFGIGTLTDPVKKMIDAGIPVLDYAALERGGNELEVRRRLVLAFLEEEHRDWPTPGRYRGAGDD